MKSGDKGKPSTSELIVVTKNVTPVGIVFKRRLVIFVMCHPKHLEFHPESKEELCANISPSGCGRDDPSSP